MPLCGEELIFVELARVYRSLVKPYHVRFLFWPGNLSLNKLSSLVFVGTL
jgi:hypothetical protein